MIPGLNCIYSCPQCRNLLQRPSIASGNDFGEKVFSDGKRIAPMLPEFPNLTKCEKCENIFWLGKLDDIGSYEWGDTGKKEWMNADVVGFLSIADYFRALKLEVAAHKGEEMAVREMIWWAFNDRLRAGESIFSLDTDEELWRENCDKFRSLLNDKDIDQVITKAELLRNVGDFEGCMQALNSIDSIDITCLKEKFRVECEKGNRWVFQLH